MRTMLRALLAPLRAKLRRWRKTRYYRSLLQLLRHPMARPAESHAALEQMESQATMRRAQGLHDEDQRMISSLPAAMSRSDRARAILDRVLTQGPVPPRFYDYDYLDDIVGIVEGRYCGDEGSCTAGHSGTVRALCALVGVGDRQKLPDALHALLGDEHGYVPPRGDVHAHVRNVLPDLADEFVRLKAETNPARFLEIGREYSRRQARAQGLYDNRELALLRGYERNHQLMLRTIVGLVDRGEVSARDEVLLVGPRYIDEVVFFRKFLGLPRTVGLDLFDYGKDEILGGDMHHMPFEDDRFRLVFCAGTLSYAYSARRVLNEMARVLRRPGYLVLIDAAGRVRGPDALGRSDVTGIDTLIGMLYEHRFEVLAKDSGRSLAPDNYINEPCLAVRFPGPRSP